MKLKNSQRLLALLLDGTLPGEREPENVNKY